MEKFCDRFLSKLTFLDLNTDQKIAEFSSRLGWSIAVLFLIHETFGDKHVVPGALIWVLYSFGKQFQIEGRLPRIMLMQDKTEEFKGLITDLISGCAAPMIVIFLRVVFR